MNGTGPVVVGLDGSPGGKAALRYGIREAVRLATSLELVYAPEWPSFGDAVSWWGGRIPGERTLSDGLAEVARTAPGLPVTTTVADGAAAEALVTRSGTASAVVVGAHGSAGFAALRLGATSGQVTLHATGPVIVVPAGPDAVDGPVVVGVDESEGASLGLWYALRAASLRRTKVVAVHAWQPPRVQWPHRVQPLPSSYDELQAEHRAILDAALGRWREAFPKVPVEYRLLPGEPAATLLAASARAGLLVVGSRGLGAIRGGFVGSVSRAVLDQVRCPVAVVHPHRHAAAPPSRTAHLAAV